MQNISSNDSTYKIPIHISQNVQIESSDNLLVVGAPKQESAEKILIPNLLSGTSSYLVIDPDGIICSELPATDFCEQKSKGASFMHSRKVLPKQNGSRLRDYSRGYLRFCSSPCFHLGMPSKSQTVLKAAAGAGTHRKITVILSHTFKMDMPDFILGREVLPLVSFRFPVQAHPYDLLLYLK